MSVFRLARLFIGAVVLEIQCDGCMADDHKLLRVGEVQDIKLHCMIWPHAARNLDSDKPYAICRVMNSRVDLPEEFFYIAMADRNVQLIGSDFRSTTFFWRH